MSKPQYPDVLGVLAERRITLAEIVQCAVGIFPTATALDQTAEVLLLLQNLADQPLDMQLTIRIPPRDAQGNLLNVFTPKPRLAFKLPAGDSGMFHIPITPQPPTQPGKGHPVVIHVAVHKPEQFNYVRPFAGGEAPSLLAISPSRLSVLSQIAFGAAVREPQELVINFDVLTGRMPPSEREVMPRYEALWTVRDMEREQARMQEVVGEALRFVRTLPPDIVRTLLRERTEEVFARAGIPLHPGESVFIAKTIAYTMADGLDLEPGFALIESRWFRHFCRLMAGNPHITQDLEHLLYLLYGSVLQDAVKLGLSMVRYETRTDFGSEHEQDDYVLKVSAALEGQRPLALEHIYVPLVMAGTMLAARITLPGENPWHSLEALQQARDGRISLADATFREVFDLLNVLIEKAERVLTNLRIPRE